MPCMDACSMVARRDHGARVPTHLPAAPTALGCCHLLQGAVDFTSMFAGHDLMEVACFLRLLYSPDQSTPATLAGLHAADGGLLRALVHLTHRLDVAGLLGKCEHYLQGKRGCGSA